MNAFVLAVTWFVVNQPPSNYQMTYTTREACDSAKAQLFAEAKRLADETEREAVRIRSQPGVVSYNPIPPRVTAICTPLQ